MQQANSQNYTPIYGLNSGSGLSSDAIHAELADSRSRLENLLGRPVTYLSVPGGATDRRVLDIAAAVGYDHVFTSALGMNPTSNCASSSTPPSWNASAPRTKNS